MKEVKNFEMAIKIYFRRFTSVFLCCLLVFCSLPVQVHATDPVTAASLAITGGQLAGAGLSGEAALSLAGPVGAVVGITLGALGVNAYVSQAAQEAGKTRTRFVLDKLVIWGAQAGYTQEQLYTKIAQGISVAADGTIQLGKNAAKMIEQFGSWLFTQDGEVVESVGSTGASDYVSFDGLELPVGTSYSFTGSDTGNTFYYYFTAPVAMVAGRSGSYFYPGFFSDSSFTMTIYQGRNGPETLFGEWRSVLLSDTNYYIQYYSSLNDTLSSINLPVLPQGLSFDNFIRSLDGSFNVQTGSTADEVFTGTPDAWAENKDVLNPSADDTPITLNPDLLNPIIDSLADGQQATMSIIDYLQALQDAWDHALDDVQTAIGTITDSLTGIQEQIAVPQDAVENPTVTNPSVTPDTTPILNPSDVDPGTAITGLSFDLTNIFPFCIPFDIYAALNLLDAEPVAPSYHVHLEWPYNIIIDFTIDLSPFNDVAAVARTMETLLFIVGLAVMTRSMFIRG